jgi:hypothetical protein
LREKCRLRVFENRMLRRIFGPKRGRGNKGIKKTEMGRICSTYRGEERCREDFIGEN